MLFASHSSEGITMTHQGIPGRAAMSIPIAFLAAGCALHPAPTQELASSEQAIASARAAGAARLAPAELRFASEKLALGRRWMAARDYGPARWLAEQALVDAELAAMKSKSRSPMRVTVSREE
jgi:hypothetical protein